MEGNRRDIQGQILNTHEGNGMKRWLRTQGAALFTSDVVRQTRRSTLALGRRLRRKPSVIHYFHQVDDPYSDLAVRALPHLIDTYEVTVVPHLVSAPGEAAAPEPERLIEWSLRDATQLASGLGLNDPPWRQAPSVGQKEAGLMLLAGSLDDARAFSQRAAEIRQAFCTGALPGVEIDRGTMQQALDRGNALREQMGHYLGAMFHFEGEWYWGLDRLPYLEQRLQPMAREPESSPFVHRREVSCEPQSSSGNDRKPVLHMFLSLRSPYTWIALPRAIELARHYDAQLNLRFVLPMVMRGLAVPPAKRFYIVMDTKREATRLGLPFGRIADPVGKPTLRGLAVLHHAIRMGKGEAFAMSFLKGVFADGISAYTDKGLKKLCERADITEEQMHTALADESWREVAEANRQEMFDAGIWGVPSFCVDQGEVIWGQDRLWLVEQQLRCAVTPGASTTTAP